jgi:hypothetical protein
MRVFSLGTGRMSDIEGGHAKEGQCSLLVSVLVTSTASDIDLNGPYKRSGSE